MRSLTMKGLRRDNNRTVTSALTSDEIPDNEGIETQRPIGSQS